VKWPKREASGRRVDAVAQHVDLIPTLLDYLGESPRPGLSGRSLLPLVEGREEKTSRPVTSYLSLDGREVESIVLDEMKLIRYLTYDRPTTSVQVFRLDDDPGETRDLRQEETASGNFLAGVPDHRRATARAPVSEAVDIDSDLLEKLRALGYVK
jgi:arylsulfatase A-like enzyme